MRPQKNQKKENNNIIKINLFAISTAKNTNKILKNIINLSSGQINLKLHFGDISNQFKASSLVRMNNKKGTGGHIFEKNKNFYGFEYQLMANPYYKRDLETFIDQLYRHSDAYRYKSHNLKNLQDYIDYYHILADAISELIIINKINHILFFNIPHLAYDTIVYQVAKALNIDVTIVTQSLIPNKFFSLRSIENYGMLRSNLKSKDVELINLPKLNLFYMKKIKQKNEKHGIINIKTFINFILYAFFKNPKIIIKPLYIWKIFSRVNKIYKSFPKWRDPFANFFHVNELAYFEHLSEFESSDFDIRKKFVYFPLPMQPEMTTSPIGGIYRDQLLAIEELSKILPDDIKIFVKENPKQGSYARGPLFFHRISRIKSVVFVPSYANTKELLENSIFVATTTGTVGWESICAGKSVLTFGYAWYRKFPGVTEFEKGITYQKIVNNKPTPKKLKYKFSELMGNSHNGIVDRAYTNLVNDYNEEENSFETSVIIRDLILNNNNTTF